MEDPKYIYIYIYNCSKQKRKRKKRVAHQNYTVDEQCNTLCEHWPNTIAAQPLFIYLIELKKKSTY